MRARNRARIRTRSVPLLARIDSANWDDFVAAADSSTVIRDKSKQCRVTVARGGERDPSIYVPTALLDLRAMQDGWFSGIKRLEPG